VNYLEYSLLFTFWKGILWRDWRVDTKSVATSEHGRSWVIID